MLNQFFIERELLNKIQQIEKVCKAVKYEVSAKILMKAEELVVKVPQELRAKMCQTIDEEEPKSFACKFCLKAFDDGRKLGGHISRAHPSMNFSDTIPVKLEADLLNQPFKLKKISKRSFGRFSQGAKRQKQEVFEEE